MARNPNRGGNRTPARDYNKKYTDKDRPSGWYNVEGKGKRYWNSYTNKWTRSPVGSTDDMIRQADKEGKIPKATNRGTPRSGGRTSTTNKDKTPDKPTGTTRNWRNGHGAVSDKPSEGDRSTWKAKETKDPPTPTPPRQRKDPPKGKSGQGSAGFRMKADLGKMLRDKPKETPKKKSRLDEALSWAADKKNKDAWQGKKKK